MITKAYKETISWLVRTPLLWVSGLFAGVAMSLVIWLEFTGGMFIAGKIAMLSVIVFPFFVGMVNLILHTGASDKKALIDRALRSYFPIVLPCVIQAGFVIILAMLLSIPFSIMGFGDDPYILTGLMIGITVPALLFSLYIDNVAVCEKTKIFETLKKSMELVGRNFFGAIGYLLLSGITIIGVSFFGAFLWGVILADRFTQFIDMNLTTQQEVFSQYTFADWQGLIGPEGILATAILFGLITFILTPFLLVFKYQCYHEISQDTPVTAAVSGEYDEKGRWYKY